MQLTRKVGFHTPYATTVYYNYLHSEGIEVEDISWKNDECDSFLYKGIKILLPNISASPDYKDFLVVNDDDPDRVCLDFFPSARKLVKYLKQVK